MTIFMRCCSVFIRGSCCSVFFSGPCSSAASFPDLEFLWIDLAVDLESIERRLLGRVGPDSAPESEGPLHSVDVAIIGVIDPVLDWCRRRRGPAGIRCAAGG